MIYDKVRMVQKRSATTQSMRMLTTFGYISSLRRTANTVLFSETMDVVLLRSMSTEGKNTVELNMFFHLVEE